MLSKKPLFSLDLTGKLLVTFLTWLLLTLPNSTFSQNTKGDRTGFSPGPIREVGRSKSKSKPVRASRGQVRSANPRKSGIFKSLLDQKPSGAPAGERASVSPKRIKSPRTASQTGRVADQVVKPYVNLSGYTPPARDQADRSGRTASGKRLITRQPSRSVNVYESSGPKPKYGAPERPREERPYAGNRTSSGKKIVKREPSDQSRNLYLGRQSFVVNPSPKPKPSENMSSRQGRVQRTTSSDRASSGNASGGIGRSASKTFVTSPKNNVYWGKFSPQRGQVTTDMYGRPLRKKDFQTASNEILPSDTVPGVNRITQTTTSANKKETANRSATRSGLAWQGDISGKKLRSASTDPRRNGPAELQKQALNIGGLSGKNATSKPRNSGVLSGAGALLKAGGKAYLKNSNQALGAGMTFARMQRLGAAGTTKGNVRTSARFAGGNQIQIGDASRMNLNKSSGGSYSGKMKTAYGGRSSGGDLKLFGKAGDELMKNSRPVKSNVGRVYGISGGQVIGKGKVDPSAVAKAPLKKDRPRRSSSRENVKESVLQARAGDFKVRRKKIEKEEPGVTVLLQGGVALFQQDRSKRVTIGTVRIYGKGGGLLEPGKGSLRVRNAGNEKYRGFASSGRSGFQGRGTGRTTIGSGRVYGKKDSQFDPDMLRARRQGLFNYVKAGSNQRPGFGTVGLKRSTIGTVRIFGKGSADQLEKANYKAGDTRLNRYLSFATPQGSTFQPGTQRRSVIGSVRVLSKDQNRLFSRQGMYRLQRTNANDYQLTGSVQRPGFQKGPKTRVTIGTAMIAGKRSYPAETRQRNQNVFQLNAGDMGRLHTVRKSAGEVNDFRRLMTFSGPGQESGQITIRQKEVNLRRANVEKFPHPKIVKSQDRIYFNFGAGSPLTRTKSIQKNPFEIKNKMAKREPANVGGIGNLRISRFTDLKTTAGGYKLKVLPKLSPTRARLENISYKQPVIGTNKKGITERLDYTLSGKVSESQISRASMNFRAWKVDEQQLSVTGDFSGKFKQERYVRHPEASADALKVREPDQAFIRIGLMQSNIRMKKMETPSFHPDSRFAHLKEDNTEGEKSLKTSIRLVFAKAFGRNDLQPSNVKDKMRRPRYDPREIKIWYD